MSVFPALPTVTANLPQVPTGMMFRGFGHGAGATATGEAAQQASRPKFFGEGGKGWDMIGALGNSLLAMSGMPGAQLLAQNSMMARRAQLERQQQLSDEDRRFRQEQATWLERELFKREHPQDQFTQYMQAAGIDPSSPKGQQAYRQMVERMTAPPMMAVDGFDAAGNPTKTFMPRTGMGTGVQPAPAGPPVGTVRNGFRFKGGNANNKADWEKIGGASPAGGATFR